MPNYLCILDASSGLGNVGVIRAFNGDEARKRFLEKIGGWPAVVHVYDLADVGDAWVWDISGSKPEDIPMELDSGRPPTSSMRSVLLACGVLPERVAAMSFEHAGSLLEALRKRDGPLLGWP